MSTTIFEQATRAKLRFATPKGTLSVEDLWELPLTSKTGQANLDDIAKGLHRELKANDEVSFVEEKTTANTVTNLKFEVVKSVINTLVVERKAAQDPFSHCSKRE